MPKITINVDDNTSVFDTSLDVGIYYPGTTAIAEGADKNKCIVLKKGDDVETILDGISDADLYMINQLLALNFNVLYHNITLAQSATSTDIDFLKDKNTYDIKYIMGGKQGLVPATELASVGAKGEHFTFALDDAKNFAAIAKDRMDCIVLIDCKAPAALTAEEQIDFVTEFQTAMGGMDDGEYCAAFLPNIMEKVKGVETELPASLAFLRALGRTLQSNAKWSAIAGVSRGVVNTEDLAMNLLKYDFDNTWVVDKAGVSLNGIVPIRPYGDVIWGDRTLLKLTDGVKATGYLSLRGVVCDIAKLAYKSAIRYTFDSNNEITWINFKSYITPTLDAMVASGVLASYKISKKASSGTSNTITCYITIYPNLPVENFVIGINLENADVQVTN